jgi:hypothetical protein
MEASKSYAVSKQRAAMNKPFNARIKTVHATLPDEIFLLGILLLEQCILRVWFLGHWTDQILKYYTSH